MTSYRFETTTDPGAFLARAGDHLAQEPVLATVVASSAHGALGDDGPGPQHPQWWVSVLADGTDGEEVVGVAMRTAPFVPHPMWVHLMPDDAALALARDLHARGEDVTAANGALPSVAVFMDELARLRDRAAYVHEHLRLFELHSLVEPRPVRGRARPAGPEDLDLVTRWAAAFSVDADEQAGREPEPGEHLDAAWTTSRIERGLLWVWEVDGRPVHFSARSPESFGVVRLGPVYTPREQRGHGWASALVAHLSREVLDEGARPTLFTDQANPVSNRIYQALGYEALADTANLRLTTPAPA
ncbi:FR47-like protein [Nocardioides dokdonensis FR1436]|uniref:FR47-like protein n=1 Tax=Nocardioides dokdonensis FR1436 TaxID=1300347 RepID=A0A1A9GL32_9ACTN|nr:GNAT family N-acetyltransferase [Nocardioides dokdonensis]ANH38806.1 FR47-like protein [Nocardioides dokdonensis FR1436]